MAFFALVRPLSAHPTSSLETCAGNSSCKRLQIGQWDGAGRFRPLHYYYYFYLSSSHYYSAFHICMASPVLIFNTDLVDYTNASLITVLREQSASPALPVASLTVMDYTFA